MFSDRRSSYTTQFARWHFEKVAEPFGQYLQSLPRVREGCVAT
jgi:hypothetical protein